MKNFQNNPRHAIRLRNRLLSYLSVNGLTGLEQSQVYGVMLVSALVCKNFPYALALEAIIRKTADEKIIDIAKSAAKHADMDKNKDFSSLLESEVVKIDFLIYMLAAFFICRFGSYIKLSEKLQQSEIIDENTIYEVIRIAGTVQAISKINKVESEPKKKILIVDDEVRIARILKRTLESTGQFKVKIENKGANAINVARVFKPDLILLDIIMPDMRGEEIAAQIREDKGLSHTRIIFLSGLMSNEETGNTGRKIGSFIYLSKSVKDDDLIHCIAKQISKSLNA